MELREVIKRNKIKMKNIFLLILLFMISCKSQPADRTMEETGDELYELTKELLELETLFSSRSTIQIKDAICYGEPEAMINTTWTQNIGNFFDRYFVCRFSDKTEAVFHLQIKMPVDSQWNHPFKIEYNSDGSIYSYRIQNCFVRFVRFYIDINDGPKYKLTPKRIKSFNSFYLYIVDTLEKSGFCKE